MASKARKAWLAGAAGNSAHARELLHDAFQEFAEAKSPAPRPSSTPWRPPYLGQSAEWLAGACALLEERADAERMVSEVEAGGWHVRRAYVSSRVRVLMARAFALRGDLQEARAEIRAALESYRAMRPGEASAHEVADLLLRLVAIATDVFPPRDEQEYVDALLTQVGVGDTFPIEPGSDPRFLTVVAFLIRRGDLELALRLALQSTEPVWSRARLLSRVRRAMELRVAKRELDPELADEACWVLRRLDVDLPSAP